MAARKFTSNAGVKGDRPYLKYCRVAARNQGLKGQQFHAAIRLLNRTLEAIRKTEKTILDDIDYRLAAGDFKGSREQFVLTNAIQTSIDSITNGALPRKRGKNTPAIVPLTSLDISPSDCHRRSFLGLNGGDGDFVRPDMVAAVHAACNQLPDHIRKVFYEFLINELSYSDIARKFGIPKSTVCDIINRTIKELASLMNQIDQPCVGHSGHIVTLSTYNKPFEQIRPRNITLETPKDSIVDTMERHGHKVSSNTLGNAIWDQEKKNPYKGKC